jgi:hypothetical protein
VRALSIVLAVAYAALAGAAATYAFFDGAFGCWDDCVEAPRKWRVDAEAWQWDAILWLGIAGAVAALLVVVLAFAGRRGRWAVPALAVHASLLTAAAVLMVGGGTFSYQFTVTWVVLTCSAALALIRVRRRSRVPAPLRVE